MKTHFLLYVALAAALFGVVSCGQKEPEGSAFDVRLDIPSEIELEEGAQSLTLSILDGKKPLATDVIVLADHASQHICNILETTGEYVKFALPDGWKPGTYTISVQRGASMLKLGSTTIKLKAIGDGVEPGEGTTVYGKVSCAGQGIPGVVVSDGYEVVQTDSEGVYRMVSGKRHKYVFISLPSGYTAKLDGVFPLIHKQLELRAGVAERKDFELMKVAGQDNHNMLIFGDIHLADRTDDRAQFGCFTTDVTNFIAEHSGEQFYAMTLGDMTWDQFWIKPEAPEKNYGFKEYASDASAMRGLPVFNTIGNHDHSIFYAGDFDTVVEYKVNIAPTYYSFNVGKVHYVVIDDIECQNNGDGTTAGRDYASNIVNEQLEWLKKDLAFVPKDRPLVITMHSPVYKNPASARGGSGYNIKQSAGSILEQTVSGYPEIHFFSAHTHKMYNVDNLSTDHVYEHNAGAVCATWWWTGHLTKGVHLCQDGTPGGYTVLKVNGTDIKWEYKAIGFPLDYKFRSYDRNEIALTAENWMPKANEAHVDILNQYNTQWRATSTDNYVYLNIWNYDLNWKIEVKEKETGKTLQCSRMGWYRDPLHIISYMVPRLNGNNGTTFETCETYHMFRVQASSPTTTLEIKVTDRFGNVSTETMTRPKPFTTATYRSEALLF